MQYKIVSGAQFMQSDGEKLANNVYVLQNWRNVVDTGKLGRDGLERVK